MTNAISNLADLYYLFDKKKFGDEEFSAEELKLAEKFKYAQLVRSLIDPRVPFGIDEEYEPSVTEIEIAFVVVSGRVPAQPQPMSEMIRVISKAIECADELAQLYAGEA